MLSLKTLHRIRIRPSRRWVCLPQISEMADRHVKLLKSSALARARKLIDVKAHIAKRADHITLKLKLITAAAALPAGVSAEMISTAMQVRHPSH